MAKRKQKDVLARLADAGEEALSRLASSPGLDRVTGVISNLKDQVDALGSRVRGLEALEKRVAELERKVDRLSKSSTGSGGSRKTTAARKSSSSRKTASRKKTES